jgi:hypothetical protein
MRIIGYIVLLLLLWLFTLIMIESVQSGDWKGIAVSSFSLVTLAAFGYILWFGRQL